MTDVLIVGCGYVGRRVAALEQAEGYGVRALARSPQSAQRLRSLGIDPVPGDLDYPASLRELCVGDSVVYYLAPPPASGVSDPRMEAFVAACSGGSPPRRVVLISTTGVYGDCQGEWVDEDRPPNPQGDRARRRLAAEQTLRAWGKKDGVAVVILRVPGIYGPGRLPEERLRLGLPVLREQEAPFSNRIHVEDLARVCLAAARRGEPGAVYNASDDRPTTMTDYFFRVADLLDLPRPPTIGLDQARRELSPGMLSYLEESRRLDNRRMRKQLGVDLLFPDLCTGLPACIELEPAQMTKRAIA